MFSPCLDSLLTSIRSAGSESRKAVDELDGRLTGTAPLEGVVKQSDEKLAIPSVAVSSHASVASETLFL